MALPAGVQSFPASAFAPGPGRELQSVGSAGPAKKARVANKNNSNANAVELSAITLPGEERGKVPVYDTCNEVRRKIRAALK